MTPIGGIIYCNNPLLYRKGDMTAFYAGKAPDKFTSLVVVSYVPIMLGVVLTLIVPHTLKSILNI